MPRLVEQNRLPLKQADNVGKKKEQTHFRKIRREKTKEVEKKEQLATQTFKGK